MRSLIKTAVFTGTAAILFVFSMTPAWAKTPQVTARSAIVMDAHTGQILFDKKAFTRKEPASLTKIITAIVALEYGHPEELVTINKKAANIYVGQELGLLPGEKISLDNLIKAALIYSANDSTVAIAHHVGGTEENFISMMNAKALILGALNTHFANTNGYHHPNHYTTAYDLALITRYALKNDRFRQIVSTPQETIYWADGKKQKEIKNTNRLLRNNSFPGILGVKTGSTIRAGNCFIAAARQGDRTLICVVLHSRNRYSDATKLLSYGFHEMVPVTLCTPQTDLGMAPVQGGVTQQVKAVSAKTIEVYLDTDQQAAVKTNVVLNQTIQAPVKAGQKVGEALFTLKGVELARVDLVAAENVKKQGVLYKLRRAF